MHQILSSDLVAEGPSGGSTEEVRRKATEEYRRRRAQGQQVVVLALRAPGLASMERDRTEAAGHALAEIVAQLASSPHAEHMHVYREADGAVVCLLPMLETAAVDPLCTKLIADTRKLAVEGLEKHVRPHLAIGIGCSQEGKDPLLETLVLVAREGAAVACARGGGCHVHTMLYGLMEGRAERIVRERGEEVLDEAGFEPVAELALTPAASAAPPKPAPPPKVVAKAAPAEPPPPVPPKPRDELHETVHRILEKEARLHPEYSHLRGDVRDLVEDLAARAVLEIRRKWESSAEVQSDDRVDRLERRLSKLADALERTEERLEEVKTAPTEEHGLSSAYRSVQGLSQEEQDYELKMSLLQEILTANLDLQRRIGQAAVGTVVVPGEVGAGGTLGGHPPPPS